MTAALSSMSDQDLLAATRVAVDKERNATSALISLLAEVDARRLYLNEGYSSMFTFCTGALRLSESAAYVRITAARTARRLPLVLSRLKEGAASLTTIGLLAPYLTKENCEMLLETTRNKGKRDVERLVAGFEWQPDIHSSIRALPVRSTPIMPATARHPEGTQTQTTGTVADARVPATSPATRNRLDAIAPITDKRYLIRITVGEETHAKLERLRALLRHQIPDGDPAAIIDLALEAMLEKAERTKYAATKRPAARMTNTSAAAPAPATASAVSAPAPASTSATAPAAPASTSATGPASAAPASTSATASASTSATAPASAAAAASTSATAPAASSVRSQPVNPPLNPHRSTSRHIPAAVRRTVWARDGGRCAFLGTDGRCRETGFLEFHHVIPFARGGPTTPDNLELRCRAHNAHEAVKEFGEGWLRPRSQRKDLERERGRKPVTELKRQPGRKVERELVTTPSGRS